MDKIPEKDPIGNFKPLHEQRIQSLVDLGDLVRERRRWLALKQVDVADGAILAANSLLTLSSASLRHP